MCVCVCVCSVCVCVSVCLSDCVCSQHLAQEMGLVAHLCTVAHPLVLAQDWLGDQVAAAATVLYIYGYVSVQVCMHLCTVLWCDHNLNILQHNFARGYSRSGETVSCRFPHLYKCNLFVLHVLGNWWSGYSILIKLALNHHVSSVSVVGTPYTAKLQRIVLKP